MADSKSIYLNPEHIVLVEAPEFKEGFAYVPLQNIGYYLEWCEELEDQLKQAGCDFKAKRNFYIKEAIRVLGRGEQCIRNALRIAKNISPEANELLHQNPKLRNKATTLLAISLLPAENQAKVVTLLTDKPKLSITDAVRKVAGTVPKAVKHAVESSWHRRNVPKPPTKKQLAITLFKKGKNVPDIMKATGLSNNTIVGYVLPLISQKKEAVTE